MNIFVGTYENCGILYGIKESFESVGHKVTTFIKSRDRFFPDKIYDFDLQASNSKRKYYFGNIPVLRGIEFRATNLLTKQKAKKIFENELLKNDLFIYAWDTVMDNMADLPILKKHKKKIIFVFFGSEVRHASAFQQQYPQIHLPWSKDQLSEPINPKLKFIRSAELYADSIFSVPDQSGLMLRPYHHIFHPYSLENKKFNVPDNNILKIVHAPSSRNMKGTQLILNAIEKLKEDGLQFEFSLIENVPNSIVLEKLQQADIAIDQLYLCGPAMFAIEAMAAGCAVATYYLEESNKIYPAPLCNVDEYSVYDQLKKLIADRNYRLRLANEGRKFVEQYNQPDSVANRFISSLDQDKSKFDYYPDFLISSMKLSKEETISNEVKAVTRQVVDKYFTEGKRKIYMETLRMKGLA